MGFFNNLYNKPGPGIPKDAPKKKGAALFFEILWRELFELIKLNLLFVVFCIPVVTIPAAITAMTKVTTKMVRDENHFLWHDFWQCFKKEILPSSLGGWALNIIMIISISAGTFYWKLSSSNKIMMVPLVVTLCVGFIAMITSFYFYPMISSIDLPLKQSIKNSLLLSIVCLGPNLLLGLLFVVISVITVLLFFAAVPVILLIGCSLLNFICTFVTYAGIRKYVLHEQTEDAGADSNHLTK